MPGSCPSHQIVLLTRALLLVLSMPLALVRCGSESPPLSVPEDRQSERSTPDAGDASPDAGCGLSFDEARAAYAPERVCQTWVYRVAAADCASWGPCSDP